MFQFGKKTTRNRNLVLTFLQEEGYKYQEIDDVTILFKAEGIHIGCRTPKNDDMFIQFLIPTIYHLSDEQGISRENILSLCNNLTQNKKGSKFFLDEEDNDNDVALSVEIFIEKDTTSLSTVIPRVLGLLLGGVEDFYQSIEAMNTKENDANDLY